ncbi:MAG: preprotein translocase subunit SecG [Gemmatimonadota bacterium]|jgi:preprotein translocase subunit SecG
MYNFLLALMVLDGLFLAVVILLQSGKGGGLAAMGGGAAATEGILGGRQATTVLTRATWIAGGTFMGLALVLSIMSSRAQVPQSILLDDLQQTAPAPEPLLPGLSDTSGGTETGDPGGEQGNTGSQEGESGGA